MGNERKIKERFRRALRVGQGEETPQKFQEEEWKLALTGEI